MRVLSIRFKSAVGFKDLEGPWTEVASAIAAVPGLHSKIWIQDGDNFGGIYVFADQASLDGYLAGPIVAAISSEPAFSEFRVEQYDILEGLTLITGNPLAVPAR